MYSSLRSGVARLLHMFTYRGQGAPNVSLDAMHSPMFGRLLTLKRKHVRKGESSPSEPNKPSVVCLSGLWGLSGPKGCSQP